MCIHDTYMYIHRLLPYAPHTLLIHSHTPHIQGMWPPSPMHSNCVCTCMPHVCTMYALERMRVVCGTYVWCMGWSACMHTVYDMYIARMLDVCRCIRYTICISYVCRVYADAYGGIGMYGMYVATYACMGRVSVVYALCMGSPAHTLYTHSHTSHIQ